MARDVIKVAGQEIVKGPVVAQGIGGAPFTAETASNVAQGIGASISIYLARNPPPDGTRVCWQIFTVEDDR